ncbi:isopeptide-forming domain-containing fimbrial protein [Aristaeella hokkaidonensis]|uniref:Isopeptide-forming domain-containing fimbrial protein n=1 Tax=Aristaeella hokkaidonensis TaxID=3046382 RepID=A0AC61MYV0_9FIRM|nr:isopeptide-forming domain-containing fimbrial protein [Aristaeella hokkaidonensis]QUC68301.1 isopeptide-forming domain-containing fimbrial protein [Aristaeella hokkaidonensis]SNT95307.1 LPXTG-motif cell wall anchor domain-containing protein/conserved repeat domain-containing protein/fimbrial isopeptide formation D2 domain-containing protein [Aristaeella hokkaidonensis]
MKKLFALMLALAMMLTVVCAFAEGEGGEGGGETGGETTTGTTSTPSITIESTSKEAEAATDTTQYTWYRILEADIGKDPEINGTSQSGGGVTYHTDSATKAAALEGTNLFNLSQIGDTNYWSVELKDPNTSGAQIAEAIGNIENFRNIFPKGTFSQEEVAGSATTGAVAPGYYYIESTAGKEVVVQTLTAVTIKEKNTFPTVEKEVDSDDKNAQIGDEITYTLKVKVPSTANDDIVLTDTMTAGLSYKKVESMKIGGVNGEDVAADNYTAEATATGFTLTLPKELVESAAAEADANTKYTEIVIVYTAVLDGDAQTANPEKNSVVLAYGEHYTTVPKETEIRTYEFTFDKVDGVTNGKLAGAEFKLLLAGNPMRLVKVTEGEVYRVAMPDETENVTDTIVTNGSTITINGLDTDNSYKLQETKAPTGGYTILKEPIDIEASAPAPNKKPMEIRNNQGTVLPSTGGSGTTIFYVIGGLLIIGAAVVLVARRKAQE